MKAQGDHCAVEAWGEHYTIYSKKKKKPVPVGRALLGHDLQNGVGCLSRTQYTGCLHAARNEAENYKSTMSTLVTVKHVQMYVRTSGMQAHLHMAIAGTFTN